MKKIMGFKLLSLFVFTLFLATSCDKFKDDVDDIVAKNSNYVGTWSVTTTQTVQGISIPVKVTATIQSASYTIVSKSNNIEISREEGTLIANGNIFTLTPTKQENAGISATPRATYKMQYIVALNVLSLMGDDNNDGKYGETGDTTILILTKE